MVFLQMGGFPQSRRDILETVWFLSLRRAALISLNRNSASLFEAIFSFEMSGLDHFFTELNYFPNSFTSFYAILDHVVSRFYVPVDVCKAVNHSP